MKKVSIMILTMFVTIYSCLGAGIVDNRNITYTGTSTFGTNSIIFIDGTHLNISSGEIVTTTTTKTNTVATSENISEVIKESVVLVTNLTYSGTNILSDFTSAKSFRVTLTNDAYLVAPTNAADGQILKWWIKQGNGGNHLLSLAPAYVLPTGTTSLTLSTNAGCSDVLIGEYDSVSNIVHLTGLLLYTR